MGILQGWFGQDAVGFLLTVDSCAQQIRDDESPVFLDCVTSVSPAEMITLRLFGSPSITRGREPVVGPAAQRLRIALLALLVLHPERGLAREKVIAYLWPEVDAERGRHLLSNSLYVLRKALGGDAILAAGGTLRLNPARVRSDVGEFLDAVDGEDWERVVTLHSAPLLDGFFLRDTVEFERWLENEREGLGQKYVEGLESVAREMEAKGDFHAAAVWWRKLCAHDGYSSRFAVHLMEALVRSGDPGGALRHAKAHADLLREELGIEPDADVTAFEERLRAEPAGQPREHDRDSLSRATATSSVEAPEGPLEALNLESVAEITRFSSEDELSRAGSSPPPSFRRSVRIPVMVGGVISIVVIGAGVLGVRPSDGGLGADDMSIRGLAVLPLENCTPDPSRRDRPDPEQEYFADGLTDALITALAEVPGLRVTSRTSAMKYKGECGSRQRREKSLPEIAQELGVDAVVEGTVVRDGERVRINAQLIRAATDEHLWADGLQYERDVRDVLALQEEIVNTVADAIRLRAAPDGMSRRSGGRRVDPVAYSHYLKGRYLWSEHRHASSVAALEHFKRAVEIDPEFAPAFSGMADVYVHLDEWGGRPEQGAREKGFEAARRALRLDEGLSEARASLAHLLMHVEDWEAAGREYRRAIQLNPSNANARMLYAFYLSGQERHDQAILEAVRALEVDPLSARTLSFFGYTLYFARRYDEAIAQWQRQLELYPESVSAHLLIAHAHLHQGRRKEGLLWANRAIELDDGEPVRIEYASALALAGSKDEAAGVLSDALREADREEVDPLSVAKAFVHLGDEDAAFRWLDRAHAGDHGWLMFLRVNPAYDALRGDPRFTHLVRRLRLDR